MLAALFITICNIAFADSYVPKVGQQFQFYPVAESSKLMNKGFDCFYDPTRAIKNGKIKIKPAYRFMVDANGVTPFSEIEGHTFEIKKTIKENEDKKVDKQNFLCYLSREDGKEILLRIPYVPKKTDNIFTQQMALVVANTKTDIWGKKTTSYSYQISLPVYPVLLYNGIKREYSGKYIVYHPFYLSPFDIDKKKAQDAITTSFKNMTDCLNKEKFIEYNKAIYCNDISFIGYKGLAFTQPVAECTWDNKNVYIPVFNFRAAGDLSSGPDFSMVVIFQEKESFIKQELEKRDKEINMHDYVNQDLRFQKSDYKDIARSYWDKLKASTIGTGTNYPLVENEVYHCYGVDLCSYNDGYSSSLSFLFEDKKGKKFEIGLVTITANNSNRYKPIFIRESEYQAEIRRREEEAESRRRGEEQRKAERLKRLTQLYGASNAKTIMEGKVRVGFTKSMCREAWGNPDDINRTITSWGTHEQWVYGHESYLYFDGDKLTTIQN